MQEYNLSNQVEIPLSDIKNGNALNDREVREEDPFLLKISKDISEKGVLQPIIVYRNNSPKIEEKYIIVAGKHRLKGSYLAGKETILARIVENPTPKIISSIIQSENENRKDLDFYSAAATLIKCLACFFNDDNLEYFEKDSKEILNDGLTCYKNTININIKKDKNQELSSEEYLILSKLERFLEENNISLSTLKRRAKILNYAEDIKELIINGLNNKNASDLHNLSEKNNKKYEEIIQEVKNKYTSDRETKGLLSVDNELCKKLINAYTAASKKDKKTSNKIALNRFNKLSANLAAVISYSPEQLENNEEKLKAQQLLLEKTQEFEENIQNLLTQIGKPKRKTKKGKK